MYIFSFLYSDENKNVYYTSMVKEIWKIKLTYIHAIQYIEDSETFYEYCQQNNIYKIRKYRHYYTFLLILKMQQF